MHAANKKNTSVTAARLHIAAPVFVGFVLRLILGLAGLYLAPLPDTAVDAVLFQEQARVLHGDGTLAAWIKGFRSDVFFYPWVVAGFYLVTGASELFMVLINVVLGSVSIWVGVRLAALMLSLRWAIIVGWLLALYPTLNLYSAITLREAPQLFCLLLGTYCLVRWWKQGGYVVLGAIVCFGIGCLLHAAMASIVLLLSALVGWRLWSERHLSTANARVNRLVFVLILVLSAAAISTGTGLDKFTSAVSSFSPESIGQFQAYLARTRAGYLATLQPESMFDLVWQAPIRVAYLLFSPMPHMVSDLKDLVGLADGLVFFFVVALCFCNIRSLWRSSDGRLISAIVITLAITYAMGTSNYGTAIRHRSKLFPIIVIMAVLSLRETRVYKQLSA